MHTPFRFNYVGSFLRPEELKQARLKYASNEITAKQLKEVEDKAIKELVAKQKELGFHTLTDGEFRRSTWHLDFMWGFKGISHKPATRGLQFVGEAAMLDDTFLSGKLELEGVHPFIEHFKFLQQFEDVDHVAKLTIPAPAQFLEQLIMPFALPNTRKYYDTNEEVVEDLIKIYTQFIKQVYAAGCRNLQFDDCSWGMLADEKAPRFFGTDLAGVKKVMKQFLDINNAVLATKPEGMVINTHVCRGNFHSTYANVGAYDSVAAFLFEKENVDAYFLEFDDERSGGFEPLAKVSGNKKVVLGLITTKSAVLEDKQTIINRIKEASKYIPLERLALSPQCGFASCEIGNKLNQQQQWDKLKLVKEIAEEVWGQYTID